MRRGREGDGGRGAFHRYPESHMARRVLEVHARASHRGEVQTQMGGLRGGGDPDMLWVEEDEEVCFEHARRDVQEPWGRAGRAASGCTRTTTTRRLLAGLWLGYGVRPTPRGCVYTGSSSRAAERQSGTPLFQ